VFGQPTATAESTTDLMEVTRLGLENSLGKNNLLSTYRTLFARVQPKYHFFAVMSCCRKRYIAPSRTITSIYNHMTSILGWACYIKRILGILIVKIKIRNQYPMIPYLVLLYEEEISNW
jgi:hypothetical protein